MTPEELQRGLPPAGDRLMTTLFVAALFHAILILGVTFSPSRDAADKGDAHGLDVVLVDDQAASAANPDAAYLAQRSQHGSGNTLDPGATRVPRSGPMAAVQAGSAHSNDSGTAEDGGATAGQAGSLSSTARSPQIQYFGAEAIARASPEMQLLLTNVPTLGITPNEDGVELRLRGETHRELWITADTRASDVAGYLDQWRRKVERIGTLNFPVVARRQQNSGTPVIAVTIDATGRLADAHISRTSGHRELDDAALRILRLAAPFDPFPAEIGANHDEIRIAYEWQFLGGVPAGSTVSYADTPARGSAP